MSALTALRAEGGARDDPQPARLRGARRAAHLRCARLRQASPRPRVLPQLHQRRVGARTGQIIFRSSSLSHLAQYDPPQPGVSVSIVYGINNYTYRQYARHATHENMCFLHPMQPFCVLYALIINNEVYDCILMVCKAAASDY